VLFNSITFAVFFIAFFSLYWLSARAPRLQNTFILLGSYLFYGWWDERFLVLLVISTVTDYLGAMGAAGRPIPRHMAGKAVAFLWIASIAVLLPTLNESAWILAWLAGFTAIVWPTVLLAPRLVEASRRKCFLAGSIAINLSVLGFFKYFNFFATEFAALMQSLGLSVSPLVLDVVLPVGISFYTFQTMSYTIDAYRRRLEPTEHLLEFSAYVVFFPQLVAGPIERAASLLPQFFHRRELSWPAVQSGLWLFAWGLYKKVVIADNIAPIANRVFASPGDYSSTELLAGLLAFTFQIYCDFSGYSDMARGIARTLGFEIMVNFRLPYLARTPSEFWRGWHISLSTWLRDYLYVPLGGNRLGVAKTYRNLMLTMLLGGLWHGANWTYIAWGAYQGLILVVYRVARIDDWIEARERAGSMSATSNLLLGSLMFSLVVFGWLLFRATTMTEVWSYADGLLSFTTGPWDSWGVLLAHIAPLILVQIAQKRTGELELLAHSSGIVSITLRALLLYGLIFLAARGGQQFIYFDF
jgi:D-alanyl-lipoteichoic acid acyltransferase DltB (MBOAT superfamily)